MTPIDDETSKSFYEALTLAYRSCYREEHKEQRRAIQRDFVRASWEDTQKNRTKRKECIARLRELIY